MSNETMTDARALDILGDLCAGQWEDVAEPALQHLAARLRGEAVQGEQQAVAWLDGDFAASLERNGSTPAWGERRKARAGAVPVYTRPQHAAPAPVAGDAVAALSGKYGNVLAPFVCRMERELHANAGKGDRPGWLAMSADTALLEIYYHVAKLQKAVRNEGGDLIAEHAADVANMAMMLLDVCGGIDAAALAQDRASQGCGACGDGCLSRDACRLADESPSQGAAAGVPEDFITHRDAWRDGLNRAVRYAKDSDDASYWMHEVRAFDRAYAQLLSAAPSAPTQGAEREVG